MIRRVAVVGGGVAGLATAHRLLHPAADQLGAGEPLEVLVLEASDRVGGKLGRVEVGDLVLEASADSFVARRPWATELCRELGLGDRLVAPGASGAYVWTDRGLVRFPEKSALGLPVDVEGFLRWPGLSRRARIRALLDLVKRPGRDEADETIGSLIRRRLGDAVAETIAQPLLGGLHAGDIDRLSLLATFPDLRTWERGHESLIRGARAAARAPGVGGPMFLKPSGGMTDLVEALARSVGADRIRTGARASLREWGGAPGVPRFVVGTGGKPVPADVLVLAVPAFEAAALLEDIAPAAATDLLDIPYASTGVVSLVYAEGTAGALPDATGFVVPAGKASMTAATFVSRKWPDEAFGRRSVVRCFVGGVCAEDILGASDEDLVEGVSRHLAAVLELPERPAASSVVRWDRAMPQYEIGHLDRVARIEGSLPPGVFLVGSAYRGVGVPDIVRGTDEIARRVREHLFGGRPREEQETAWTS